MPILNYTTKIAAAKTVGEIQAILAKAGAQSISIDYDEHAQPIACCHRPSNRRSDWKGKLRMATKKKVPEVPAVDRAITLWQPYASLLLAGLKTYETRSWPLSKPGWIAIHAARSEPADVRRLIAQPRRWFSHCLQQMNTTFEDLPRGAVIGLAHFGPPVHVEEVRMTIGALDADFGNWTEGRWAWPVLDIWPFPEPVPARGKQGIWRWSMSPDLSDAFAQHWLRNQQ